MGFDDIIQTVYTGQFKELDLWDKLVQYFVQYWDGEPDIFQQVRDLSGKQLGSQICNITTTSDYFSALENNFSDKNDLLEFLINLTGYLNYHSESGSINVKESLQKFRKKLREFRQICIKRGIFKDTHFVGREDEIFQMKEEIRIGKKKGMFLNCRNLMKCSCACSCCFSRLGVEFMHTYKKRWL